MASGSGRRNLGSLRALGVGTPRRQLPADLAHVGPAPGKLVAQDCSPRADSDPTGRAGRRAPGSPGKDHYANLGIVQGCGCTRTRDQMGKSFSPFLAAPTPLVGSCPYGMELAGAAPSQLPESHVEQPRPPPQPPEKDSSKGTGDMMTTEEEPFTDQETELGQTNSSSLNSSEASLYPLSINGNQAAVKFGPDSPLCNSMASVLKIGEQSKNANPASTAQPRNGETQTCTPSTTASDSPQTEPLKGAPSGHQNGTVGQCNGITSMHPIPCFPGPPFVYPWSPAWNGIPAMAATVCPAPAEAANSSEHSNTSNVQWNVPPMVPVMPPGFCGTPIPFPVMPPSVWPFITPWPNGAWSQPWLGPSSTLPASPPTSSSTCSDGGSPVLGKHSRDSKPQGDEKSERCLWIPKTLRIDDPDEAAKSSIWTTLGIEPGERGMFRPFQSKPQSKEQISGATRVLQANPAAMSRSQSFQENT
ncbi:hypothetical protein EJB05_10493, partial [Eragrostis curvula]